MVWPKRATPWVVERRKREKSQKNLKLHKRYTFVKKIYRGRRKNGYPGMKMGVRIERRKTVKKERGH